MRLQVWAGLSCCVGSVATVVCFLWQQESHCSVKQRHEVFVEGMKDCLSYRYSHYTKQSGETGTFDDSIQLFLILENNFFPGVCVCVSLTIFQW